MSEEWQTSAGVKDDLKLVLVFLEMNDAVRNGYSRFAAAPPVSNRPGILRQVSLRLFQLETVRMGTLRRVPQYGEAVASTAR